MGKSQAYRDCMQNTWYSRYSFMVALLRIWPSHLRLRGEVLLRIMEQTVLGRTLNTSKRFRLRKMDILFEQTHSEGLLLMSPINGTVLNKPCVLSATL